MVIIIMLGVVAALALLGKLVRRKLYADFNKNVNLNLPNYNRYRIYSNALTSIKLKTTASLYILVIVLAEAWSLILGLLIGLIGISIISIVVWIDYIPNFFFKCPKCKKNLVHFRDDRSAKYSKRVYFRCEACGFETVEDII